MENTHSKFSVIVPLYNGERYIENCIRSIERQSYDSYEILVIDDGSTDNSYEIAKELERENKQVKVLHQANSGPYNARLAGICHAVGDYLFFLDCDDELRGDTFQLVNSAINKYRADMVLFNASKEDNYEQAWINYPFKGETVFASAEKMTLYEMVCTSKTLNNLATKCIKRSLFSPQDFEEYDHFLNGEDLFMVIPALDRADRVVYLPENLYYYRQNNSSTTHNYNPYLFDSISRVLNRRIEYAQKWGGAELVTKTRQFAAAICVSLVEYEINGQSSALDRVSRVSRVIHSETFQQNIRFRPKYSGKRSLLLYYLGRYHCPVGLLIKIYDCFTKIG